MTGRLGRTGVAALLVAVGVIVPCAAWFVVGSRAAREQAARLESGPGEMAQQEAARLAGQVSLRLEALRQSESRRPFEEYLSGSELLPGDCAWELAERSPLAAGPVDPLIWTHFQIDDLGLLTLPTLGDRPGAPGQGPAVDPVQALQVAILDELECASADHIAALHRSPDGSPRSAAPASGGVIAVQPFFWHTVSVKGQAALVAVREIGTPSIVLTQGFVVLSEDLSRLLHGSLYPATLRPGRPTAAHEAAVAIHGDSWAVAVDSSLAAVQATDEARRVRGNFYATFSFGSLAALLAGCATVLLVRRTDRLARERARFAAAAAHELRTPLAGMQLFSEMLADGTGDPSRAGEYARRIADETQRMGRLVTNMLGLARLERGEPAVHPKEGNLAAAVRDSLERLRPALETKGATIVFEHAAGLPTARFDADALHQILQNLLDNAERHGRGAADRSIGVELGPGRRGPTLSVTDHGPGIAPEARRALFRPFGRDGAPSEAGGLGIGLALVAALARAQGAVVSHEPAPGGGARFSVRFRAAG
jgi:signal transduction histidine kinase